MILDMIKKPKWQHRSPDVREESVAREVNDPALLAQIAQQDDSPKVRCAALRKINDLALLTRLAEQVDEAESVRKLAQQRFKRLLGGDEPDETLSLETRLSWIRADNLTPELIEHLARQGHEIKLRLTALALINRESLLGDIAGEDANGEVRLAAVEKITQKSTLERVYKATRNRDKRVSRLAKEKLETLIAIEQRPAKLREEVNQICVKLESMGRSGAWEQENAEYKRLQDRWHPIAKEATALDATLAERFQQAADTFVAAYAQYQQAQEAILRQEQALAPLRAIKQTLCEQVETLNKELHQHKHITDAQNDAFRTRIETLQQQWSTQARLDNPTEEARWYDRFNEASDAAQKQYKLLKAWHNLEKQQATLCDEAEQLLEQQKPLRKNVLKDLQTRWDKIPQPSHLPPFIQVLNERFTQDMALLEDRLDNLKNDAKQLEKTLKQHLNDLEDCLGQGEFQTAMQLEQKARSSYDKLNALLPNSHRQLEKRLQDAANEIRKLRSWQRWGDDIERERLCEAMEVLAERPDDNPEETARLIREAQLAWKQLGTRGHSQELWERFNTACNVAYQPCRDYFEGQAQQRIENLEKKEQLCAEVEAYVNDIDWQTPDWKALNQYGREVEKEWHHIGPTNRKNKKPLSTRFENALQPLQNRLAEERTRNIKFRQRLIEKAADAVSIEDLGTAIETVKQLQSQWIITVPGERKEERQLWRDFRKACDAVFDRRKQQQEERDKERNANLAAKNALCEQIEALATLEEDAVKSVLGQLKKLQLEWRDIGELPRKAIEKVEKRYKTACTTVEQFYQQQLAAEQRSALDAIRDKALACAALENIDYATVDSVEAHIASAQASWSQLPTLPDAALEAQFAERFEHACQAVLAIQVPSDDAARQARDMLCIRMEILAEVESPPEAMQARMEYQVARLSAAMQGGGNKQITDKLTEAQQIEQEWYLAGALTAEQTELNTRFERALTAFYTNSAE